MKAIPLLALLMCAMLFQPLLAQDTEKKDAGTEVKAAQTIDNIFTYKPRWGVGVHGGLLSGMGLGVRFHPQSRFSAQLVGGGIKIEDDLLATIGAEGQFDLDVMAASRLYALVGLGWYQDKRGDDEWGDNRWRIGAGIGYEWAISSKMVFLTSLNFTYFTNDGSFWPLPQAGIFYYFK
jgi:hypothetical protein